jgi:phage-related protein
MARLIFDSFVDARTFVDGNAQAKWVQRLALGTVAAFDALFAAFRIERNVVAGPGAAVGANLVRLATTAVNTFLKNTKYIRE